MAEAAALLTFSDTKSYMRTGVREYAFEGGALDLDLNDGSVIIAGCLFNGTTSGRVFPNGACPTGTHGFVVWGDIDGDGVRDTGSYWSIAEIERATNVAPGEPERIQMVAAPFSDLPRPLDGGEWEDTGVVIWYNELDPPIEIYEITRYAYSRVYGANELERQFSEIVPGPYNFEFPLLDDDLDVFPINVDYQPMIEAWPGQGPIAESGDFAGLNDDDWREETRQLEVDPRLFYKFEWRGFSFNSTLTGDQTFFSMIDPFTDLVVYPPYGPSVDPIERFPELIDTPSSFYDLGPNFFEPGDVVIAQVEYIRDFPSTANSSDTSERQFRWPVSFIDSYAGFALSTYPPGSDENLWGTDEDFDGDGFTNLEEFGLQTDPSDPASVPVVQATLDSVTNQYIVEVAKRPFVGAKLIYEVEYSTDQSNWTVIEPGDPNWIIEFDDADAYKVRSFRPYPTVKYFVRVKLSQL